MFTPMTIVTEATAYLKNLCSEGILDDNTNGIPIIPLAKVIPIILPIPNTARKEIAISKLSNPETAKTTSAPLLIFNKGILKHKHIHPHQHADGVVHTHPHDHDIDHKHGHKSYLIGCIHGLAGSGALVVLAVSGLDSFEMAISFLAVFGIGSIIGMTFASGIIGIPFVLSSKIPSLQKFFRYAVASVTIVIGANIIYEVTSSGAF